MVINVSFLDFLANPMNSGKNIQFNLLHFGETTFMVNPIIHDYVIIGEKVLKF